MNNMDRPKVMPLKLKDLLDSSDECTTVKQISTDRKKVEPMRIKDLIKSLSDRKHPKAATYTYPTKSVDRQMLASRKSIMPPTQLSTNARRKLYSTHNTPQELNRQSRLLSTTKTQPKPPKDINRTQASKKSLLLPPNSVKDYFIRKRQSEGIITEAGHQDASVQTDIEIVQETCNNIAKATQSMYNSQCASVRNFESTSFLNPTSQRAENASNGKYVNTNSERQFSVNSIESTCASSSADNINRNDKSIKESKIPKTSMIVENGCGVFIQPLLANPICLQIQQNAENLKTVNHVHNLNAEHVADKDNLLAIEKYLKEGIVNMTQALNLVQAMLCSNNLLPQVTVPAEKENVSISKHTAVSENEKSLTLIPTPVPEKVLSSLSESLELMDIKIEPKSSTKNPTLPLIPSSSETNITYAQSKFQEVEITNLDLVQESSKNRNEQTSASSKNLLLTPKRNSKNVENNLLKTPRAVDRNSLLKLITPCRRTDNKENFQTPMSRRKTFTGFDSQNLRRSERIARHHLMHSLGEDSFLALEKELDIVYPRTNM